MERGKKRVFIIVVDSMGIGAMKDCKEYGDKLSYNTLVNTANAAGGLNIPIMEKMGLGNLADIKGVKKIENPIAQFGILQPQSKGKDTTTGHWELMGLVLDKPFKTYPKGFDKELIDEFIEKTGCKGILGNCAASGTAIIEELNEKHQKTKFPVVYTSADSVFQIAVDTDLIPLETLYEWCETARKILDNGWAVSRVIARPYKIIEGSPKRISGDRRDYSVPPPEPTALNLIEKSGKKVYGIGKIEDIFVKSGITKAIHTASNKEGLELTLEAIKNGDYDLTFTNLVDTDMLFGHRRNSKGYAEAVEQVDTYLEKMIKEMKDEDLLIITADHGCDPTADGTDHTREKVPVLIYSKNIKVENLGDNKPFSYVAEVLTKHLGL